MDIKQIIELVPKVMYYLVPGYCFLKTMSFVNYRKIEDNEYIILKSIVLSYVFISLGKIIQIKIGYLNELPFEGKCLLLVLLSIISGYVTGRLFVWEKINMIIEKLKIPRTRENNIWYDIFNPNKVVYLRFYKNDFEYIQGQMYLMENDVLDPRIILKYAQIYKDGELYPKNYRDSKYETMVRSGEYKIIEIINEEEAGSS